ncbi:MAG: hypothetical protein JWO30_1345 [Fibrobacteres bacterium]|nr:hypothetical protein [Fibrobacterota bacterium]
MAIEALAIRPASALRTYAGLFCIAMATLMYEILLTRIFSVTMWYHFAFMAISIAMFGMTFGAILVYLLPGRFHPDRRGVNLGAASLAYGATVILSFLAHLALPYLFATTTAGASGISGETAAGAATIVMAPSRWLICVALTFVVTLIPFIFSGIAVTLALTGRQTDVGRMYAADLAGAALGCPATLGLLAFTDAPSAVFVIACLAGVSALCFAPPGKPGFRKAAWAGFLLFAAAAGWMLAQSKAGKPVIQVRWTKSRYESAPLWEKWNSFSRLRIDGDSALATKAFGWGLSHNYPGTGTVRQVDLNIDAAAATPLTAFDGDLAELEHLKYDVTNMAHYLRKDAEVLVVGVGGGRDVLSALAFGQKSVLGVELNGDILGAITGPFGNFTGHLDRNPKVTLVNDEARSFIARSRGSFDIIQVSLVDTWAATSAGAFVLSESSLYTVEAWDTFLKRLKPDGILTFSRWYFQDRPGEMYRLTSLACAALRRAGVENPRDHIMMVRRMAKSGVDEVPDGVGTILVGRRAFTAEEVETLGAKASELGFEVALDPGHSIDSTFSSITAGTGSEAFLRSYPLDLSAPTDNRPFFFHMLRLNKALDRDLWKQGVMSTNLKAVAVLAVLLALVLFLTAVSILVPLRLAAGKPAPGSAPLFLYFSAIGLGFMLLEIAQMQRLNIFLGHPTYALSTVLFTLLLSSGLGSFVTGTGPARDRGRSGLILLLAALCVTGFTTTPIIAALQSHGTAARVLASVVILFPMGFFMGMAFPLGMKWAIAKSPDLGAWLWGINGAASVCASVLTVALSMSFGIAASYWIGVACYLAAFAFYAGYSRSRPL